MLNRMRVKLFGLSATVSALALTAGCAIEEWKFGIGPVFSHNSLFGGVAVELQNGFEFIVPLFQF